MAQPRRSQAAAPKEAVGVCANHASCPAGTRWLRIKSHADRVSEAALRACSADQALLGSFAASVYATSQALGL